MPWGRALASALSPLTAGIAIGTLALVSYDTLFARIERLTGALDRLGAETIDAIAMATPPAAPSLHVRMQAVGGGSRQSAAGRQAGGSAVGSRQSAVLTGSAQADLAERLGTRAESLAAREATAYCLLTVLPTAY